MKTKRRLRPGMLMTGALTALLAGACHGGPEGEQDGEPQSDESESAFTVGESGNNNLPPAGADPLRNVDDGIGNLASTIDTDWWYTTARSGDEVYAFVDPGSDDSFLEIYTDANLTTPLDTDAASGPDGGSAVAAVTVPAATGLVFYNVSENGGNATIANYELMHYVGDPSDDQLELAGTNDTVGTAQLVAAPIVEGTASTAADIDYWAFEARAGDTIALIVADDPDSNGILDTEISIRDGNDTVLLDGDGDDLSTRIFNAAGISVAPADGTYYARFAVGNQSTGAYRFVVLVNGRPPVSLGPMPESQGGTFDTASTLSLKSQHSALGEIQSNADIDYSRVIGKVGDRFYAYVDTQQATPGDDSFISLRDGADNVIETDDAGGPGNGSVIAGAVLTTPVSYLRVEEDGQNDTISDLHIYAATIDAADVANEVTPESNATIPTADDFTSTRMRGTLNGADTDYWRIPARAGDNIVVITDDDPDDAAGSSVDTTLEIVDGNGIVLATGDNGTNSGNAVGPVEIFVDGDYYARVENGGVVVDEYEIVALVTNGPVTCGDGDLDGVEGCDDSNTVQGDGCDADCTVESGYNCSGEPTVCTPACGDGNVLSSEDCDDGNTTDGDGCSSSCAEEAGYTCSGMPSMCVEVCGDGTIVGTEACDDGNNTALDGCGANCAVESGWTCNGEPSQCMTTCGDGVIAGNEVCDDGNTLATDGCGTNCAQENGWTCNGEPSVCTTTCGDGVTAGVEECDDGNNTNGDGCSSTCMLESSGQGGAGPAGVGGSAGVGGGGPGATTDAGATSGSGGGGGRETVAESGGCSCRVVGGPEPSDTSEKRTPILLALLGLAVLRRRRS